MMLPLDVCRCLGEQGYIHNMKQCENRYQCERFLQNDVYGPTTPFNSFCCQTQSFEMKIHHDNKRNT